MTKTERRKKGIEPDENRRSSGLFSFGADVRHLIAPLLGKKGLMQADILARWKDILGDELSAGVTPFNVSFSKQKEGALLTVKAFSGAFAVEFSARKEQILQRINAYFGYDAIADIRIVQGGTFTPPATEKEQISFSPRQEEKMREITAGIEDESLRQSLFQLGLAVCVKKD